MFTLTLVTPEKRLVTGQEIEEVFVPAYMGELNILPGHAAIMTTLTTGVLKYRLKGQTNLNFVAISWGYCQVNHTGVNVLAETAERPEEIDSTRAEKTKKEAELKLASADLDAELMGKYLSKVARASVRQDVASRADGNGSTTH